MQPAAAAAVAETVRREARELVGRGARTGNRGRRDAAAAETD